MSETLLLLNQVKLHRSLLHVAENQVAAQLIQPISIARSEASSCIKLTKQEFELACHTVGQLQVQLVEACHPKPNEVEHAS